MPHLSGMEGDHMFSVLRPALVRVQPEFALLFVCSAARSAPTQGRRQRRIMKYIAVSMLAFLVTSASCLRVPGPPTPTTDSAARVVRAVGAARRTAAVLPREALDNVYRVARGGGGEGEGVGGIFARAAVLPLVRHLSPQVWICVADEGVEQRCFELFNLIFVIVHMI